MEREREREQMTFKEENEPLQSRNEQVAVFGSIQFNETLFFVWFKIEAVFVFFFLLKTRYIVHNK